MIQLPDAYDLRHFYNSLQGKIVRRLLRQRISSRWPDCKSMSVLGYGYALPYLEPYKKEAERTVSIMPSQLGVHNWPQLEKNLVCAGQEDLIPLETNSIDRIIAVHCLEFLDKPNDTFQELWRILKSNGRLILIVPNRVGLWARSDHSPFGQGQPYSTRQLEHFLKENLFVHEHTSYSLYMPPFRGNLLLRTADLFEKMGRFIFPGCGGVQIIEISKQIYAGTGKAVPSLAKKVIPVKPATTR
ncbi:MAG: class I SAM-dependent methyltransferase [Pseudomonadota bacterium]